MRKQEKILSADQLYGLMVNACSKKECCTFDIHRKLKRMNVSEEMQEAVIKKLKEERFIDEERYIRSFINDKIRFNKWGRKKIELALLQKQLSKKMINEVFSTYTDEVLLGSLPVLLEKKWHTITGKSLFEKKTKLIRYGLGKGFSIDEIKRCIGDITGGLDVYDE